MLKIQGFRSTSHGIKQLDNVRPRRHELLPSLSVDDSQAQLAYAYVLADYATHRAFGAG